MLLNYIDWTWNPDLLSGVVTVRWYGLMFVIGFLLGYMMLRREFRHEGAKESYADLVFMGTIIATIIGARLGHVIFYEWSYYSQHPLEILYIWQGGLASHGGTIAIVLTIIGIGRHIGKNPLWIFDRLVIPTALVAALIRIGNLFNHEIYGHETNVPWAFRFIVNINEWMHGAEPIFSHPSHPTQIYEAGAYFILYILLMWLYWKKNAGERPGLIFGIFFVWVFTARFFIEFIKNDQEAFEQDMLLNMGQLLSIPFIIIGIGLIAYSLKAKKLDIQYPDKFAPEDDQKRK